VSDFITLQTLHRRFLPGTPFVGLILQKYSRQKRFVNPWSTLLLEQPWSNITPTILLLILEDSGQFEFRNDPQLQMASRVNAMTRW